MITLEHIQKYFDDEQRRNVPLTYNTKIVDLGFDSLELLELISYVEKHFAEIKLSEINGQMSMQEFIELVNNKIDKPEPSGSNYGIINIKE
ncbi:MAG: acyl carrier protein [Dysgonamonadaceae bacterium]|jgi:acyl carrier protein|nr:acyl carrier protein [Dysgonamonadaceae bacterium]